MTSTKLTDPMALRAYAHPTRMALLGLLRLSGPRTATEAAAEIGESVASCSFHLRQLAKYGLVEEAPAGKGRARPWRATTLYTSWRSDSDDPQMAAAATMLDAMVFEHHHERARDWLARRGAEPKPWRSAAFHGDAVLYLTPEELSQVEERVDAIVAEFAPRRADESLRPEGSRQVYLITLGFPL